MSYMKTSILIQLFLFSTTCFAQQQKQFTFKQLDYPTSKYTLTADTTNFGKVQIITNMVASKESSNGFLCRSWLTIRKNHKVLKQKFYEIEPVGGCSGIFLPSAQPLATYFIISKFGDYEGKTLLIDTTGKLVELKGGSYSISADKRYLFSLWDSDVSGITIFDLTTGKTILSKENENDKEYNDIYFQDGKFYVSSFENNYVETIDVQNKRISMSDRPKGFLKKTNKLKIYNDVQTLAKCNCGRK
jgi:hypothetical protein